MAELKDAFGWAALAVEQLEGNQVPMEATTVHYAWHVGSLVSKVQALLESEKAGSGPHNIDDPVALLKELDDLGVVTRAGHGHRRLARHLSPRFRHQPPGRCARMPV
ncbi:hypothetical protein ACFUIY_10275 [Streptomyces griseorubiginosus]|uniref:hypothetical protein n=1 Tax=Streptomyces griseorubiginosus TaxID=67304 RepID=UPI00363D0123